MADPLDKQLVEAVLSRPRRAKATSRRPSSPTRGLRARQGRRCRRVDDDDDDDDDLDLGAEPAADGRPTRAGDVGVEVVGEDGAAVDDKLPADAPAKLDPAEVEEPTAEELEAISRRHDRDRRPGPDVPQGDRQGRPADRRGRGRPGQGDRARRAARRGAVEGDRLAPRVDAPRHGAQDPDDEAAAPPAVRRRGPRARPRRDRRQGARRTCWSRRRTSTSSRPAGTPSPTGRRSSSRRPRSSSHAYNEKLDAGHVPAAPRLGVLRGPQRRSRLARQRRAAGDLRLDARRRRVPGARALDHGRQRRRPAQADGLRPRGAAQHEAARTARASSSGSGATRASS